MKTRLKTKPSKPEADVRFGNEPEAALIAAKARERQADPLTDSAELEATVHRAWLDSKGLGPLSLLLADPSVSEIMINGPGAIWVDREGRIEQSGERIDSIGLARLIERILDPLGLQVDRSSPSVDARLDDGSRVHVVIPPLALGGPVVTIRRFTDRALPLAAFGDHSMTRRLRTLIEQRRSILVVGGTATGKTSLLNAIGALFGRDERIITIEDTAELRLPGRHVVRLEARPPNREGIGEVTIRDLVRDAMRMRPDRLIVGEVRGAEALDLLLAQSSGHQGSLASFHADSPEAALRRLETLALLGASNLAAEAVGQLVRTAVEIIVHLERVGSRRQVTGIAEVPDAAGEPPSILWAAHPRAVAA